MGRETVLLQRSRSSTALNNPKLFYVINLINKKNTRTPRIIEYIRTITCNFEEIRKYSNKSV